MDFESYKKAFQEKAISLNKDDEFISKCLNYAKNLNDKNLPIIYDINHFSLLVGVKVHYLLAISNSQDNFYRSFSIPKHNGKLRKINEPLPLLKEIQYFILNKILLNIPCNKYSKAYQNSLSVKDNARFHRNQPILIKLDIKDYFPNLNEFVVFKFFNTTLGYNKSLSILLSKLCTLNNGLPQGSPTSPYLSNLLTVNLDDEISTFCSNNGKLRYTRYADDIFISGDIRNSKYIISSISKILYNHDLKLNKEKIAVIKNSSQQMVTGIVVNKKLQAAKSYRKEIRLEIYYCKKFGLDNHFNHIKDKFPNFNNLKYCQHLLGKINFCLQINPKDKEIIGYKDYLINELKSLS